MKTVDLYSPLLSRLKRLLSKEGPYNMIMLMKKKKQSRKKTTSKTIYSVMKK